MSGYLDHHSGPETSVGAVSKMTGYSADQSFPIFSRVVIPYSGTKSHEHGQGLSHVRQCGEEYAHLGCP